jgi:hypothetical protein
MATCLNYYGLVLETEYNDYNSNKSVFSQNINLEPQLILNTNDSFYGVHPSSVQWNITPIKLTACHGGEYYFHRK